MRGKPGERSPRLSSCPRGPALPGRLPRARPASRLLQSSLLPRGPLCPSADAHGEPAACGAPGAVPARGVDGVLSLLSSRNGRAALGFEHRTQVKLGQRRVGTMPLKGPCAQSSAAVKRSIPRRQELRCFFFYPQHPAHFLERGRYSVNNYRIGE